MAGKIIAAKSATTTAATTTGYVTIASTTGWYVGAKGALNQPGQPNVSIIITEVASATSLGVRILPDSVVGPVISSPNYGRSDVSAYNAGTIYQYDQFLYSKDEAGALSDADRAKLDAISGANTGDVTLAAVGAVPNANAASLTGQVLNLQPANATNPGVWSVGAQHMSSGTKTLHGILALGYTGDTGDGVITDSTGGLSNAYLNLYSTGCQLATGSSYIQGVKATSAWNFTGGSFAFKSAITVSPGGSIANPADVGGRLDTQTTPVGNVGVGEDTLMTYTVVANALNISARGVEWESAGTLANNANAKTLKLYFGTVAMIAVTLPTNIAADWIAKSTVIRTGASTQRYVIEVRVVNQATNVPLVYVSQGTLAQTETNTIVIKATGEAVANNDIVQNFSLIKVV